MSLLTWTVVRRKPTEHTKYRVRVPANQRNLAAVPVMLLSSPEQLLAPRQCWFPLALPGL